MGSIFFPLKVAHMRIEHNFKLGERIQSKGCILQYLRYRPCSMRVG